MGLRELRDLPEATQLVMSQVAAQLAEEGTKGVSLEPGGFGG